MRAQRRIRKNAMNKVADELRRKLLLEIHFNSLLTFKSIQNKKLMQKRTLEAYLTEDKPVKKVEIKPEPEPIQLPPAPAPAPKKTNRYTTNLKYNFV